MLCGLERLYCVPARFDFAPLVGKEQELIRVQTMIAQFPVERSDKAAFYQPSLSNEVEEKPGGKSSDRARDR